MLAMLFSVAMMAQAGDVQVLAGDVVHLDGHDYRLYHIDAPQTGVWAGCESEQVQSRALAAYVGDLIAHARTVELSPGFDPRGRRSWPDDRVGRRLATITVDGRDLGALLVSQGRATVWDRHQKHDWCR